MGKGRGREGCLRGGQHRRTKFKKKKNKTVNDQLGMDRSEGGGESKRSEHGAAVEREDGERERVGAKKR